MAKRYLGFGQITDVGECNLESWFVQSTSHMLYHRYSCGVLHEANWARIHSLHAHIPILMATFILDAMSRRLLPQFVTA